MAWLEQPAGLVFTSAGVVMVISLVVLSSSWRALKDMQHQLPPDQQKFIVNMGSIKDKQVKLREEMKFSLLISVGATMVGIHGGTFELHNYNFGRNVFAGSIVCLSSGIFFVGLFRLWEAISLIQGDFYLLPGLLPTDDVEKRNGDENSSEVWARCGECGTELKQGDTQCPKCGSTKKAYEREASVTVGVKVGTKATQKRIGFHRFMKQMVSRWKPSVDPRLPNGVQEETVKDKEKDWYDQVVRDAKTGEITHEEHEPLSQHRQSSGGN